MRVTKEESLACVREVFAGTITRDMIIDLPPRKQVYVAVAIMLAFPEHYLRNGIVMGHFKDALDGLLVDGNPRRFDDDVWYGYYTEAYRNAGLYQSTPGQGGVKPIRLTPPPELVSLIAELGVTPAAMTFREESLAGIAAETQRMLDGEAANNEKKRQLNVAAEAAIERLAAEGGGELVWAVYDLLHEKLRRQHWR